jgi:hypothetical protein
MRRLVVALLTASILSACAGSARDVLTIPTAPDATVPLGVDFTLAPGESVIVNGSATTVTFVQVTGDSRCPNGPLIQCVWAGSAVLALRVQHGSASESAALETVPQRDVLTMDSYALRLVAVTPERTTLEPIPSGNYRATFRVTRR